MAELRYPDGSLLVIDMDTVEWEYEVYKDSWGSERVKLPCGHTVPWHTFVKNQEVYGLPHDFCFADNCMPK